MRIDNGTLHTSVTSSAQRQYDPAQTETASVSTAKQVTDTEAEDSQGDTTISRKAYAVLGADKGVRENSAASSDTTEQVEKMIEQLQEQIKEKQAELQQVMRDQSLSDEERLQQAQAIQAELAILQASLVYAYNSLAEAGE